MKLVVIYNYFEEGRENITHTNYNFFIKYGYYEDSNIYYIFVINGKCTIKLLNKLNIFIYRRDNIGYDFGAYGDVLRQLPFAFDYYFFLNSSVRGPFIPTYCKIKWYEPYINLMKNNVKLVGSSINIHINRPHVQSYFFLLNYESLQYLLNKIFNKEYYTLSEVINYQEIGMSEYILQNNWNIDSLIPEQQGINWLNRFEDEKYKKIKYFTDMIYSGKLCNGRDLHPYELIFIKVNRNLSTDVINSLTNYLMLN